MKTLQRRYLLFLKLRNFHSQIKGNATIEVVSSVDCISTSTSVWGRELVYAYLTDVGFSTLLIHLTGQCEGLKNGKQPL